MPGIYKRRALVTLPFLEAECTDANWYYIRLKNIFCLITFSYRCPLPSSCIIKFVGVDSYNKRQTITYLWSISMLCLLSFYMKGGGVFSYVWVRFSYNIKKYFISFWCSLFAKGHQRDYWICEFNRTIIKKQCGKK